MKRIILSVIVMAFAVAAQASDVKNSQDKDKDKPACCASKAKVSDQAKGTCPFAKSECCKAKAETTKQVALQSPKAGDSSR